MLVSFCRPRTRQHRRAAPGGFGAWRVTYLLIAYYRKYDYLFSVTHVLINQLNYMELRATTKTGRSWVSSGPAAHPPGYGEGLAALPSRENPPACVE